jgi:dienelactone hydrolase
VKLTRVLLGLACITLAGSALAQELEIRQGEMVVGATNFGEGDHVVIALHGNRGSRAFFKDYGDEFARSGLRVISIDWPGKPGTGARELGAAVQFAREQGARKLSLVGFSRGAELAASYASAQADGEFDTVVLLASGGDQGIPLTKTKKLFIYNKYDSIARWTPVAAGKSAEPKQVIALGGSGHGIRWLVEEKPDLIREVIAELKR